MQSSWRQNQANRRHPHWTRQAHLLVSQNLTVARTTIGPALGPIRCFVNPEHPESMFLSLDPGRCLPYSALCGLLPLWEAKLGGWQIRYLSLAHISLGDALDRISSLWHIQSTRPLAAYGAIIGIIPQINALMDYWGGCSLRRDSGSPTVVRAVCQLRPWSSY